MSEATSIPDPSPKPAAKPKPKAKDKGGRPSYVTEKGLADALEALRKDYAPTPAGAVDPIRRDLACALFEASIRHNGGWDQSFTENMWRQFPQMLRLYEAMVLGELTTPDSELREAKAELEALRKENKVFKSRHESDKAEIKTLRQRVKMGSRAPVKGIP